MHQGRQLYQQAVQFQEVFPSPFSHTSDYADFQITFPLLQMSNGFKTAQMRCSALSRIEQVLIRINPASPISSVAEYPAS